jgi:hypothetical protein
MRKIFLASALAFGTMTSVAMAAPTKMTDAQLDTVVAGQTNVCVVCANVGVNAVVIGNRNNQNNNQSNNPR